MRSGIKDYRSPSQRQRTDSAQLILDLIGFVAHLCQWCQLHCNSNPLIIMPRWMPDDQREHQSELCNWNILLRSGLWAEWWCRPTISPTEFRRERWELVFVILLGACAIFLTLTEEKWQKKWHIVHMTITAQCHLTTRPQLWHDLNPSKIPMRNLRALHFKFLLSVT